MTPTTGVEAPTENNKIKLTWMVPSVHRTTFDLDKAQDRVYAAMILGNEELEDDPAALADALLALGDSSWPPSHQVGDELMQLASDGNWFDCDPGSVEVRAAERVQP